MSVDKKYWGKHLNLMEFCYNSTTHSAMKMSPFELTLGKEAMKPLVELAIHVGQKDHSKKAMEMVKGHEELYAQPNKLLEQVNMI